MAAAMSLITDYGLTLLVLSCTFGFFMAWGVGANDVANATGPAVGARALSINQAIVLVVIFEFCGVVLGGTEVTDTIKSGIVDTQATHPDWMVLGMMSSLLASATWLLIATLLGWPVSTTQAIVGALLGFAVGGISFDSVQWNHTLPILCSWFLAPILSGVLAFAFLTTVQHWVIDTDNPFRNARRIAPIYIFLTAFLVISTAFPADSLSGENLPHHLMLALGGSALVMLLGILILAQIQRNPEQDRAFHFSSVERVFAVIMVFTSCAMAFTHGANDLANAIGPLAAIVSLVESQGQEHLSQASDSPAWVMLLGGMGIVLGLVTAGQKVMQTVGHNITQLTPTRGFAAQLATACTVAMASSTGLPISTTQTLVGAIVGIGIARGLAALNLRMIAAIFISWVITLPASALLSLLFFTLLKYLFTP